MKKSLLLLASLLMSVASFAQWTKPVPTNIQDMATDGTAQFLYNKEAGGFFAGANDWGTRASVATAADSVKFVVFDGENYNFACFPASKNKWLYVSCNGYDAMWVDASNAEANSSYPGTDSWRIEKNSNGSYKISNTNYEGTLGIAEIYRGEKGNTRTYINDPLDEYIVNDESLPSISGNFYNEWYFIDSVEYKALQPKVIVYLAAVNLEGAISRVKLQDENYDLSALNAVYNNTSSTKEELDAAVEVAEAAIAFSKALATAQETYSNLDFSAPIAVYNNNKSTKEELEAAKAQIQEIINTYLATQATFEDPISFDIFGDGGVDVGKWTRVFTGTGEVGTWHTNTWSTEADGGADGTDMTTPFCEDWVASGSLLSDQKIYQTLAGAAPGLYKFHANVRLYNEKGDQDVLTGCVMYFGENKVDLSEKVEMYKSGSKCVLWKDGGFDIIAIVKESADIEFGFDITSPTFNWIAFKDLYVKYYGNENVEQNALILSKGDTEYTKHEEEDANAELIAAYNEAVDAFNNASTAEEIAAASTQIALAKNALDKNIAAYKSYKELIDQIETYFLENDDLAGEKCDLLSDYIMDGNEVEPDEDYPYGSSYYILTNHFLNDEQLAEETERVSTLFKEAVAESLYPGKDCTNLLSDADFSDANGKGWTVGKLGAPGAWTGGLIASADAPDAGFPVCEAWHRTFDIYQEVNVPNGIYAVSLNGFVRRDSGAEVEAEVYMNNFATKFMDIQEGGIPMDDNANDGFNCYLSNGTSSKALTENPIFMGGTRKSPNDATDTTTDNLYAPNGMEGASVAFSAGRYQAVAYGLVTDGKIRLGVRNPRNDDWCLWGNFKLTYMGKDQEALESILPIYREQLATYEENNQDVLTDPTVADIEKALAKADEAADADEMYDALIVVNDALIAAQANKAAVEALNTAVDAVNELCENHPDVDQSAYEAIVEQVAACSELTTEGVEALTEKVKEAGETIKRNALIQVIANATAEDPQDITDFVITNARFDDGTINGWTDTFTEGNHGYQSNEVYGGIIDQFAEGWKSGSALSDGMIYQEITLPAGSYILSADMIAKDQVNSEEVTGLTLFAGENSVEVSADSSSPAHPEVAFTLTENSTITIGIAANSTNGNWVAVDNFMLVCTGYDPTAISSVATTNASATAIYSVSGTRSNKLQKGINIVKMSNGTVQKVLVK